MPMRFVPVNVSSSGNNTLIAGVAGHRYVIYNYVLVANGTVGVKFISGATDISGVMPLVVNSGVSATGTRDAPVLQTIADGDSIIINLSAAVAVTGHLTFYDSIT